MLNKHHIVILAGGGGTRLWPESKLEKPKPFLHFPRTSDLTLLKQSVLRAQSIVPEKNVWMVMHKNYKKFIEDPFYKNLGDRVLFEPEAKNTAPAIVYACLKIANDYGPETVITFLPCDHYIEDSEKFLFQIQQGSKIASDQSKIVTYGIPPIYPSTNYGYIKTIHGENAQFLKVEKFTEKPSTEKAKEFLANGGYFWNSGIFTFSISTFFNECEKHFSDFNFIKSKIKPSTMFSDDVVSLYDVMPNISIDYALMEKSKEIVLMPANFGWSDIGTWEAVKKVTNESNVIDGEGIVISGENNYIRSEKPVVLCGLSNVYVIQTESETLVVSEDYLNQINEIRLKAQKK